MTLSLKQKALLEALKNSPGKRLIRAQGGFWYVDGCKGSLRGGYWVPDAYWTLGTVRALERHGLLQQDPESEGPERLRARVLTMQENPTTKGSPRERIPGTVKWWNDSKGYGFIHVPGYESVDIFAHYTAIHVEGFKTLKEGQAVTLRIVQGPKGPQADEIRPLESK